MQRTPPNPPSPTTRSRMQAQVRQHTSPELAVRRALHARGLRYRLHQPVPGAPRRRIDIAFPRERVAVFVDGCFWHGCPRHARDTHANTAWWSAKRAYNAGRDADTDRRLLEAGWIVVRCWEHEDPQEVATKVENVVHSRRSSTGLSKVHRSSRGSG
ncbi:MAG TPA: very short patch repair endonuclease [Actinomycetes bacterium]|nr:very short patch repair endonuclease [Actinomycetes bacterium]